MKFKFIMGVALIVVLFLQECGLKLGGQKKIFIR